MSAYAYPNFKTKKSFKKAVRAGAEMRVMENTPIGGVKLEDGVAFLEGPHYPEAHKWYAKVLLKDGKIVKIS